MEAATQEYHRAGRGADAVALAWRAYDERTDPAGYQRLCEQARLAGVWQDSRERALAKLRAQVDTDLAAAGRKKTGRPQPWAVCDASALVSVFLFEGEVDQAWSEAQTAGCSRVLDRTQLRPDQPGCRPTGRGGHPAPGDGGAAKPRIRGSRHHRRLHRP